MLVEKKETGHDLEALYQELTDSHREMLDSIPVYTADSSVLKHLPGYSLVRGVLCAFRRRKRLSAEALIDTISYGKDRLRVAVLESVVNPTNVGAIFRSAAAMGMDAVIVTSDSSDPLYRRAARVSMGTVFQIPWTYADIHEWTESGIGRLHAMGLQ